MPRLRPLLFALLMTLALPWGGAAAQNAEDADDNRPALVSTAEPPADVWERLRRGFAMPGLDNERVAAALAHYTRDPRYLPRVSARAGRYLYHIIEEVEARKMPAELALLPYVESAFQPEALSRVKASGLWQFMPATGKTFQLQQNRWKDERRDVLESTRAALDYFERLYKMFGDWHLCLAAYNWGEGNVMRAIKANEARGLPGDYGHLRMPAETANYVPKLEAVKRIVAEPEKYGIELPDIRNEPYFVRVTKNRDVDLKTAARLAEMPLAEFKQLNPSFNAPVIVASHNSQILLPADRIETFLDNLVSWVDTGKPLSSWTLYRIKEGETLASVAEKSGMSLAEIRRVNHIPESRNVLPGSVLLIDNGNAKGAAIAAEEEARLMLEPVADRRKAYRVRRGDTLFSIARKHGVTPADIRAANRLPSSGISVGQRIMIPVRGGAASPAAQKASPGAVPAVRRIRYEVKRGDTIYSISRRYGTSPEAVRSANGLRTSALRTGQVLLVPAPAPDKPPAGPARGARAAGKAGGQWLDVKPAGGKAKPRPQPQPKPQPKASFYTVQKGDTLYSIARRHGLTVDGLRGMNRLRGDAVGAGARLRVR
ncbi:MAG: LysM peptidoglycan-binding domain-containing protein [Duodenibacillus sp.]|nr:LysM peptidoglycan-binding domain-containing protein [Duodenibacillus sp.]